MAVANETQSSSTKLQDQSQQSRGTSNRQQGGQQVERSQRGELTQRSTGAPYFPSATEFFYNPFAAMRRMHEDMDRMFAQAFGAGGGSTGMQSNDGGRMGEWSPAIEVKDEGNNLKICAELPGLKPEEVKVKLNDNVLTIEGERRQERSTGEGRLHRTERQYGRFYRAIALPEGAQTDQVNANFHDGILEINVPVPQTSSQRREIPISSGSSNGGAKSETTPTSTFPQTKP